jgi:acyl-CoA synthetase (AMP-forming)/AMP-acid ligase II
MASGLRQFDTKRNDVIMIVMTMGPDFIVSLYAAMLAGAIPVVVAPPRAFQNHDAYLDHLRHVIKTAAPRLIVATVEFAPLFAIIPGQDVPLYRCEQILAAGDYDDSVLLSALADLALLQFTGGSTGRPRGVRVPYSSLRTNVAAIRSWLAWSHDDAAAFWAPHYHDMGLIGGLIAPLTSQCDTWLLTPEQFIRRPIEYLRCFGQRNARLTALPSFGLDYIVRRIAAEDLVGMDFSAVKGIIIGAELIDAETLTRFSELLQPFGLRRGALLPAYGLAEATLAVCGVAMGEAWTACSPRSGGPAIVGCGRPLGGIGAAIVDEAAIPLPEGEVGEIVIHGASVALGYQSAHRTGSLADFEHGTLHSGDAGFCVDGQIFPIGRLGDGLKIRGQTLFAEWLENDLAKLGYPRERFAVLLGMHNSRPTAVWIFSRIPPTSPDVGMDLLCRSAESADVYLIEAGQGAISRTSSGKPRRRAMWNGFIGGQFSANILACRNANCDSVDTSRVTT